MFFISVDALEELASAAYENKHVKKGDLEREMSLTLSLSSASSRDFTSSAFSVSQFGVAAISSVDTGFTLVQLSFSASNLSRSSRNES